LADVILPGHCKTHDSASRLLIIAGASLAHWLALIQDAILPGYRDSAEGRMFESTGDFKADMAMLEGKEAQGWQ
jgi:hypothetical protein